MSTKSIPTADIQLYINTKKKLLDNFLEDLLNNPNLFKEPQELWDAIRYSLLNGGKRLRGVLCLTTLESLTNKNNDSFDTDDLLTAASLEIIHAMSLIHDDLPSMDDDDLRRGKPSCHKAFSESTAILAGDAMLTLPFYLISKQCTKLSDTQKLSIIQTLSFTTSFALVPGQIMDLAIKEKNIELNKLEKIYANKTAELIKVSILCGAYLSPNNIPQAKETINYLSNYGSKIGLAFQIIDDILDETSDTKTLGKTSGKDKLQNKPTYPMLLGIDNSRKIANELINDASSDLNKVNLKSQNLQFLAQFILNRIN
ncbi:MAG: polyprenyl synthetase family protein [Candidatus Melainabacteria bacterium]|nr:polyprenyl synthetase family protein [Candidatus Melainabacteria bacterium]